MSEVVKGLKVCLSLVTYIFDLVTDKKVMLQLCCHNAGEHWTQILNPVYCSLSFVLLYGGSVICNAVAFRQFLGEFDNPVFVILFAVLGILPFVLPTLWFLYCIVGLLSPIKTKSNAENLYKGTAYVKMFEAIFESAGQMCVQMFLLMEEVQRHDNVIQRPEGAESFTDCMVLNTTQPATPSVADSIKSFFPGQISSNLIYISIVSSLLSVCYTIVKWVFMEMKQSTIQRIGYVGLCLIVVGSRVYLKSTMGTYWPRSYIFINFYWALPLIAANFAQMIYTAIAPGPKVTVKKFFKRWISGTCDFLSADGLPTSSSYFICAVLFNIWKWGNIHLQISLGLNTFALLINIAFSFIVKDPIFKDYFDQDREGIYQSMRPPRPPRQNRN